MTGSRVEVGPGTALPFLSAPHDTLRHGLPALKADAQVVHPVEVLQRQARGRQDTRAHGSGGSTQRGRRCLSTLAVSAPPRSHTAHASPVRIPTPQGGPVQSTAAMQASVYGTAFPARQAIEKQLVGRCAPSCLTRSPFLSIALTRTPCSPPALSRSAECSACRARGCLLPAWGWRSCQVCSSPLFTRCPCVS